MTPMNNKKTGRPNLPRLPSVVDVIDKTLIENPEQGPSSVYSTLVGENVVNKSVAELPRNRRQVRNSILMWTTLLAVTFAGRNFSRIFCRSRKFIPAKSYF